MTDQPKATYEKLNPRVVLTTEGHILSHPIQLTLYNKDGSSPDRKSYSNEELAVVAEAMFKALPENTEMRLLLCALEAMSGIAENAALYTLSQMQHLVHDEKAVGHLDHDLLCPGVLNYFNEDEVEEQHVTPENTAEVLNRFFVGGRKPH